MTTPKHSTLVRVENDMRDKPFIPGAYALTSGDDSPTALVDTEWLITALTFRSAQLTEDILSAIEEGYETVITEYVPLWGGCIHDMQEVMAWLIGDEAKTRWKEMQLTVLYPALTALGVDEAQLHWTITQTRSGA